MIQNQMIVRSLPLVASVLGKRYGVKVAIGGDKACTDGTVIHLPALPPDSDETLLGLVRGFVDHESAHIRATDFNVIKEGTVTPLAKHIWNILEDWRVENSLARVFPGCRANFDWLIEHQFAKASPKSSKSSLQIVNYILFAVRAWDVPDIAANRDLLGGKIWKSSPALFDSLNLLLDEARGHCNSSQDCMDYARRIVALIGDECQKEKDAANGQGAGSGKPRASEGSPASDSQPSKRQQELEKLLNATEDELPQDIGKAVAEKLGATSSQCGNAVNVAVEATKKARPLDNDDLAAIGKASAALHARLHALLQSTTMKRSLPARNGKLDTHRLHKITHDPDIFLRHQEKQGINTLVHVLLDCSGSMRSKMPLACQACYAIASSLSRINGIRLGITAFPAGSTPGSQFTVYPLLRPDQKLHTSFLLDPSGNTPMGESLWWVMQEMLPLKETRKIIVIITDGRADVVETTEKAIEHGRALGFEFYGVGIHHDYIRQLLPDASEVITNLDELVPSMFRLLQRTLTGKR
jgi:cobalamin biosynthesis protein CobT